MKFFRYQDLDQGYVRVRWIRLDSICEVISSSDSRGVVRVQIFSMPGITAVIHGDGQAQQFMDAWQEFISASKTQDRSQHENPT